MILLYTIILIGGKPNFVTLDSDHNIHKVIRPVPHYFTSEISHEEIVDIEVGKEVNTCIDAEGNTIPCFAVHGGFKGLKFSWEVSGVRQDTWANENRIQVEVDKEK